MRFELRAICAELRHEILKLDPIRHAQGCPLLGGMAIKCDRISRWTKGNALQYSIHLRTDLRTSQARSGQIWFPRCARPAPACPLEFFRRGYLRNIHPVCVPRRDSAV